MIYLARAVNQPKIVNLKKENQGKGYFFLIFGLFPKWEKESYL